ncbi:peptidoglycan-binding protein [Streptomyces scopuliridis]|uniref:peptidoglycan-binding domain-containing protein n=1 Tax=Streptomyces scopuliridis TaxID=452529 RepID=UPI0036B6A4DE
MLGTASVASASPAAAAAVVPADSCGYYSGTALTQRGNSGPRVYEIQCLLNWYSGYPVSVTPDGDFGPATERGVRWLQSCAGLTVDGLVGTNTWRALRTSSC